MLWPASDTAASTHPEGLLLDAIASGALDTHLSAIADAIDARRALLHTIRSATAVAELRIGDQVRITRRVRPRYLEGQRGVITELDQHSVSVKLARPVGRFHDGELRLPPLGVEKLELPDHEPAA
jgi:hypothetical protein